MVGSRNMEGMGNRKIREGVENREGREIWKVG